MPAARPTRLRRGSRRCSPASAADGRGAIGEDRRRQHVRGLVAELAGDVARLAENPAALDRPLEQPRHRHLASVDDHRLLGRRTAALAALVDVAAVAREHQAFGDGLGGVGGSVQPAVQDRDARQAALPRRHRRRAGDPAQALHPDIRAAAAADQRDPRGLPAADHRKHEQLERFGLEFLGAYGPGDGLAGRLAQTLEQGSRLLSLEYRQEQDVGFDRGCLGGHHADGLGRKRRRHPAIIW